MALTLLVECCARLPLSLVVQVLHSQGVNLRYLGSVLQYIPYSPEFEVARLKLLAEMIARTLKNSIRERVMNAAQLAN